MKSIADAIKEMKELSLLRLDIGYAAHYTFFTAFRETAIQENGIQALAEAIKSQKHLATLFLSLKYF